MKLIETPVFNDDGSVKGTFLISPEEAKNLLQFSVNFLVATGQTVAVARYAPHNPQESTVQ